jgi:aspartyl-tRNA(Asn)/glutamyl-tRNA(Gln) amidotransferase subunit A
MTPQPQWMTIAQTARALRSREVSARELVGATLDWIEASQPLTRAWTTVTGEAALAAAAVADQELADGIDRGPMHGVGFGVKDVVAVAGVRMTVGSQLTRDFVPREDATVVAQLRAAGGICLGKTVTHEFAFGSTSPPARNPWDGRSVPGGSSGGSASAVAAGQVPGAVGTDNCCSVRNPAALTGICGIRPTFGRVSTTGVVPASLCMDTVGPLCRSVEDVALMLAAMTSYDPRDPRSSPEPLGDLATVAATPAADLAGLRIGVPQTYFFERLEPDVEQAMDALLQTLRHLGAELVAVDLPHARHALGAFFVLDVAEEAALQHDHVRRAPQQLGEDVRRWAELGSMVLATDYIRAQQMRALIVEDFRRALADVDLIVTPATAATAKEPREHPIFIEVEYPDGSAEDVVFSYGRFLIPVSMAGLPGLALPCGYDNAGLPFGAQLVARAFDEATALRVGAVIERELALSEDRPPAVMQLAGG